MMHALTCLSNCVLQLQKEMAIIKTTVSKGTPLSFTFKMTNFNEEFFGPLFYASPNSYKMCVRVYSNGHLGFW